MVHVTQGLVIAVDDEEDCKNGCGEGMSLEEQEVLRSRFFRSTQEEALLRLPTFEDASLERVPGFAQPLDVRGSVEPWEGFLLDGVEDVMCLHWHDNPGGNECVYDYSLRYTSIRATHSSDGQPLLLNIFTCDRMQSFSSIDDTLAVGCSNGFQGSSQVLYLEGPTFLFSRTPHFPHFLEEVADAMTYLLEHNLTRFEHAVIDISGGSCMSFDSYVTGLWAPSGSPLRETLQILMLQTVASGIVFSWGIRPGKSVCFGSPWRRPTDWDAQNLQLEHRLALMEEAFRNGTQHQFYQGWNARSHLAESGTFQHPRVCARFRSRLSELLRPPLNPIATGSGAETWLREGVGLGGITPRREAGLRVLVLHRFAGGRVVTNLHGLAGRSEVRAMGAALRIVTLGTGRWTSARAQAREFLNADVVSSLSALR